LDIKSQFIHEVIQSWDSFFQSFSLSDVVDKLGGFGSGLEWVSLDDLPMGEDALREGFSGSGSSEGSGESEGFRHWQEGSDHVQRRSDQLFLV